MPQAKPDVHFSATHTQPIRVWYRETMVGGITGSSNQGWCLYEGSNLIRCAGTLRDIKAIATEHFSGRTPCH